MMIREIQEFQAIHYDLLILADPDKHLVEDYVKRSICFEAIFDDTAAGILALLLLDLKP